MRNGLRDSLSSFALILCLFASVSPTHAAVISIDDKGNLTRDGKPFRAIGINVHDAFWRMVEADGDNTFDRDFAALEAAGIPFARVAATYYYPGWLKAYLDDRDTYLARLDGVVRSAESHNVGLILDLFWFDVAVPDLVGEPRNAWGKRDSKTIAFMREYTSTIVNRYKESPALWGWEFGNEYNLAADLPNAADNRPPTDAGGMPTARSGDDDLKTEMLLVAFTAFADTVRELDPMHPITSGNSIPRNFAESTRTTGNWTKIDSKSSFKANLALVTPDPMDMISIHLYPDDVHNDRFANSHHPTYEEILKVAMEASAKVKKPLFVGEWGASLASSPTEAEVRAEFEAQLKAIVDTGVPLAALWELTSSATYGDWPWTINDRNGRTYMLDAIHTANLELERRSALDDRIANLLPQWKTAIKLLDKAGIKMIQSKLKEMGFYKGTLDGSAGKGTQAALTGCVESEECVATVTGLLASLVPR